MTPQLQYLIDTYGIDPSQRSPIAIPDVHRRDFGKLLKALDCNRGAEIGVTNGDFSEMILQGHPDAELYGVDICHTRQAPARLGHLPRYHFLHNRSHTASKTFADASLDFVYIDGDHTFRGAAEDLESWVKKVRSGGVVAGHDLVLDTKERWWADDAHCGKVTWAVNAYIQAYRIPTWFVLGEPEMLERNGQTVGVYSWMWIR